MLCCVDRQFFHMLACCARQNSVRVHVVSLVIKHSKFAIALLSGGRQVRNYYCSNTNNSEKCYTIAIQTVSIARKVSHDEYGNKSIVKQHFKLLADGSLRSTSIPVTACVYEPN
jgi:hypothetical protein